VHGGEIDGCDRQFHDFMIEHGMNDAHIVIRPGDKRQHRYWRDRQIDNGESFILRMPKPYLERNDLIAMDCGRLLACPYELEEQLRSGTWATIRYARRYQRPITIIFPDGSVKEEEPIQCSQIRKLLNTSASPMIPQE
jgi:hypothetical protein